MQQGLPVEGRARDRPLESRLERRSPKGQGGESRRNSQANGTRQDGSLNVLTSADARGQRVDRVKPDASLLSFSFGDKGDQRWIMIFRERSMGGPRFSSVARGQAGSMTAAAAPRIAERIARLGTETAFAVSAEAAAFAAAGNHVYPFHLGDMNLRDPRERRRGLAQGDQGRQDRLLPQRRHPGAARGAGRRRLGLARRRLHGRQRRHRARRQAGDRQVPADPHEPRRRGPLSQPGLSHLRVADRVPGRRRRALRLREGDDGFAIDLEALEAAITPRTRLLHLQRPAEPHGRRVLRRRARAPRRARR